MVWVRLGAVGQSEDVFADEEAVDFKPLNVGPQEGRREANVDVAAHGGDDRCGAARTRRALMALAKTGGDKLADDEGRPPRIVGIHQVERLFFECPPRREIVIGEPRKRWDTGGRVAQRGEGVDRDGPLVAESTRPREESSEAIGGHGTRKTIGYEAAGVVSLKAGVAAPMAGVA